MAAGADDAAQIRQILVDYRPDSDPLPLTRAVSGVQRLVRAAGFANLAGSARALVWTLGAIALTYRSRTANAEPGDLDLAISWTEHAVQAWPDDDPNLPRARTNLATALTDRYERGADPADLTAALALFSTALPGLRAHGDRLDVALHSYGSAYHAHATAPGGGGGGGGGVADLDRAIDLFTEALRCPEPDPEERAGYLNSLGLSQRAKGRALADPALLARSAETFGEARDLASFGGEAYLSASINLATVLEDRAETDNDVMFLEEAVRLRREVLPLLSPSDQLRQVQVTTNLAAGLIDLYRHTRDRRLLDDATRDLRANAERMPDGPVGMTVLANLAAALHEMFDYTGRLALLDEAIAVQERLVAAPNPRPPERTMNLGVSLLARFRRRRSEHDLDRAIELFEETARVTTSAIDRAAARNSQANALSLRFDESGVGADLDRCIELRDEAVRVAPDGSLDRALYQGNLGVDLLKRFELGGGREDLRRALDNQRQAVHAVPASGSDQPRLLAGLADSLAQEADRTRRAEDAEQARTAYRRAVETGQHSLPEQALGASLRWGGWESRHRSWTPAVEAYELGLAALQQLVADQELRGDKESWLADAQELAAAASFANVQAGDLPRAATVLEHGRAMLLAEALAGRTRLTSTRATVPRPSPGS
jgi:tetratricopeptide (TPR) repeat protein